MNSWIDELVSIREDMLSIESRAKTLLETIPECRRPSARNLLHYVALRQHDIRELQDQLVRRGLSSLGRCESFVLANLEAVLSHLEIGEDITIEPLPKKNIPVDFSSGQTLLRMGTVELLGTSDATRPSIMVTMDCTAANDFELVRDLVDAGMSVMRINCAHDNQDVWAAIIANLRRAESELRRECRVAMDLAGPKIRTSAIRPGPRVVRWKPRRDVFGRVTKPAMIWIGPGQPTRPADSVLSLADQKWSQLKVGDTLKFLDAAGRARRLCIVEVSPNGVWAEATQTSYVTPATLIERITAEQGTDEAPRRTAEAAMHFDAIPQREDYLVLQVGDHLRLTDPRILGQPAVHDSNDRVVQVARIGCTLAEIFNDARCGQRVLFDDGKIAGVILEVTADELLIEITRARSKGEKLRADKGINLPDTDLSLPALTPKDSLDLAFIAANADIVSYSFVRRVEDICRLRQELKVLHREDMDIILKIENRQAFDNLPLLLLEAMKGTATGVMVARGDLAIECGFERLVEVQEEILWMCEAAHVPVIWATQVLEELAKSGLPTRAEVTDAGMGARAECVMLNKGDNIVEAVRSLKDILCRMQTHQIKKRSIFRRLHLAEHLLSDTTNRCPTNVSDQRLLADSCGD